MDSDQLRFLLFGLGILLVLGIYWWDKFKQHRIEKQQHEPFIDEVAPDDYNIKPMELETAAGSDTALSDLVADLSFNAVDAWTLDPALREIAPRMIIQLNIVAPDDAPFTAQDIAQAARTVELEHLDGVYQRRTEEDAIVFSMASMLEPGVLPLDDEIFTTQGLTLFSQLPGACDGLAIYSDMLFTAERLVALLDGALLDENHSVLSKQTVEHTREMILEHRRQMQLLKKHDKR